MFKLATVGGEGSAAGKKFVFNTEHVVFVTAEEKGGCWLKFVNGDLRLIKGELEKIQKDLESDGTEVGNG